jgi:hypothetical protein
VFGALVALLALAASALPAQARPEVTVRDANDGTGTLTLVGSGWRPGQRIVLVVGRDSFQAEADPAGEFEVPTELLPLASDSARSLTVRRADALPIAGDVSVDGPHPWAVLFAQTLASGAAGVTFGGGVLAAVGLLGKRVRRPRRERPVLH